MFVQEQIVKLSKRLKDIEERPNPNYLKCNKLMYEMQLEEWLEVEEDWKTGNKPFSSGLGALARPLGFHELAFSAMGDRVSNAVKYRELAANKFGFPDKSCDRTMAALGLYLNGDIPLPKLMVTSRGPCEPLRWSEMSAAKYLGILSFEIQRLNSNGEDNLRCLAEQWAELIEFAETCVPGIKYDEEKLIEAFELQQEARPYIYDLYELRKRVPSPLSNQDAARLGPAPPAVDRWSKGMEYLKAYHDEMFERAEKGTGRVGEEKLRIAWLNTFNYGRGTMDLLTEKGVSLVYFGYGGGPSNFGLYGYDPLDESAYGRKLTPLEEMAARGNYNVWGNQAEAVGDTLTRACRELKIDAVVDFLQVGCYVTKGLSTITAERVKNEVGIPTLGLEGREHYMTEGEQAEMYKKLEEFLDMCIANKN